MGLDDIDPTDVWSFDSDADDELVEIIDKHLPEGWKKNKDQSRQIYRVVESFLKTPQGLETDEREKRAQNKALEMEENVNTDRTIPDATGRRLYSLTPYREKFRRDLEHIERDYQNR